MKPWLTSSTEVIVNVALYGMLAVVLALLAGLRAADGQHTLAWTLGGLSVVLVAFLTVSCAYALKTLRANPAGGVPLVPLWVEVLGVELGAPSGILLYRGMVGDFWPWDLVIFAAAGLLMLPIMLAILSGRRERFAQESTQSIAPRTAEVA